MRASRAGTRGFSTTRVARFMPHYDEGPGTNLPFSIGSRGVMATKMLAFVLTGFGIPPIVVYYHLHK